jgi:hypothetical protein
MAPPVPGAMTLPASRPAGQHPLRLGLPRPVPLTAKAP